MADESDTETPGLLVSAGESVFFVPGHRLDEYRLTDEAAADARGRYTENEVAGFAARPDGRGPRVADFAFLGPTRGPLIRASYSTAAPVVDK